MNKFVSKIVAMAMVTVALATPTRMWAQNGVSVTVSNESTATRVVLTTNADGNYVVENGEGAGTQAIKATNGKMSFVPVNKAWKIQNIMPTDQSNVWQICPGTNDGWFCLATAASRPAPAPTTSARVGRSNCEPIGWQGYSVEDTLKPGFGAKGIILAESTSQTVVISITNGLQEVYVQGDDGTGGPKIFNSTYPVLAGKITFPRQGALAMEVKFACSLTSEHADYVSHGDGWFEYHGPWGSSNAAPAPSIPTKAAPTTKSDGILSDIFKMVTSWAQSPLFWIMLAIIVILALIGILISGRRTKS